MIVRARALVTMDGEPIANGAVAVCGNRISDVGSWPEVRSRNAGAVVDVGEQVLLPGLINAHCHLDYTLLRGVIPPPTSFADWIRTINARKAEFTAPDYVRAIESGLAEAAKFGTTTIVNLEAFPELVGQISNSVPMRIWWMAEMIDVRSPVSPTAVLEALEKAARGPGGVGLAPHAPFTASAKLYAETVGLAAARNIPATTHLAESAEEMAMFRDRRGALFDFMSEIGRPMEDCGTATPLKLARKNGHFDARWIVAHLNELTEEDLAALADAPRFHVVHCPRSHGYYRHALFALEQLRGLGFNIALGTDSLASNPDLSLFAEMRQVQETALKLRASEILAMATTNGAAALGQAKNLGRLSLGFSADLIAVPFSGVMNGVEEEILAHAGPCRWRMLDGVLATTNE